MRDSFDGSRVKRTIVMPLSDVRQMLSTKCSMALAVLWNLGTPDWLLDSTLLTHTDTFESKRFSSIIWSRLKADSSNANP